jgi:AraC-like DNA-binding protein
MSILDRSIMRLRTAPEPVPPPGFLSTQVTQARSYFFNLRPARTRETVVACGGCERLRSDYVVRRGDFPFVAIEFVAEGQGTLELGKTKFRLGPGMAFSYGPGVTHVIRTDPDQPMLKYYVDFVGPSAERLLAAGPLGASGAVQLSSHHELTDIFELLQREGVNHSPFSAAICAALLPVLIAKIAERALPGGLTEPRALETFERTRRLIEREFLHFRSAEEAAHACHIDPAYLCRLFQRFAHTTPWRFITRLKMSRAAELLLDGRMMVKEVADALEFADAFHFSRSFKRVYGISPGHFVRQRHPGYARA